ncbi:MAG: signal peptidase II [Prochlorococcus sp. SP3034]|nr:signal peptidase II [Prochlorococcus sp. SP3034]|tara:strand:- start:7386 stop:7841 length:456 start_codon:yes stop_codon:yes gene_type:complete
MNISRNSKANIILIFTILIFDQITKYIVSNYQINSKFNNLYLFSIDFVKNEGAAFNLFSNNTFFLSLISIFSSIIISLLLIYNRNLNVIDRYGLSFILAGSIGNGIDRVINGYVVDFINLNFISFPVFNIADLSINIGFFLILYNLIIKTK